MTIGPSFVVRTVLLSSSSMTLYFTSASMHALACTAKESASLCLASGANQMNWTSIGPSILVSPVLPIARRQSNSVSAFA